MDLEGVIRHCETKPGASKDFPFDLRTLVMKVGGRMFLLTDIDGPYISLNLKCDPALARELRAEYPAITPGYHMNKEHWNTVVLDGSISDERVLWMIDHSYELVAKGLSKRVRTDLGI